MLRIIIFFEALFLLIAHNSCVNRTYVKEGLVSQYRYFTNFTDSIILPDFDQLESKIWFEDSCIIYEMKFINDSSNYAPKGQIRKYTYERYKYSYLDLRTLRCQDYANLSDTARPKCNYFLHGDETVNWRFYAEKKLYDLDGEVVPLSDTTIKNKNYKRLKITKFISANFGNEYHVFYLNCQAKKTIFHINRSLDEKYPKCQIALSEIWSDRNPANKGIFELNVLKTKLSREEKKIFKSWAKNAKATKLPLLTYSQAIKSFQFPVSNSFSDTSKYNKTFDLMKEN